MSAGAGQIEIAQTVTIGRGTLYPFQRLQGLIGTAGVRSDDVSREIADGVIAQVDSLEAREVICEVAVNGDADTIGYQNLIDSLTSVMRPRRTTMGLRFNLLGDERILYVRPRGMTATWDDDAILGAVRVTLRFVAPDPIAYSTTNESANASGASTVVANIGNAAVAPTVVVNSPSGIVELKNVTDSNKILKLNTAAVTGLGGATIDFRERTITSTGGANLAAAVAVGSEWWTLVPGNNTISVTNATSIDIDWAPGWL